MSEGKNTNKELRIIESALREVIDFIGYVDIPTGKLYVIRHCSEEASEDAPLVFDYDEGVENIIQVNILPEDKAVCHRMFSMDNVIDTVDRYGSFTGTFRVREPNSAKVQFKRVTMRYLDLEEKDTLVAIQHDFTEVAVEDHQIQENIRGALNHAENISRAKSKFLFHMTHELRTPLNAIVGLTQLGKNRTYDHDYVNYCFEKIDTSSKMMLDMIDAVLDIAHIENNDLKLDKEAVLFVPFIENVAAKARSSAYAKKVNFKVEMDEKIAPCFNFDADRFEQVLGHLLSNAVKFTQRFGTVTLDIRLISDDGDSQSLEISVKDTGVGIHEDFKPRVFQPFAQEYAGSATTYGGVGLGLAICQHIIKVMGGIIEFESLKGEGSTFTVNVDLDVAEVKQGLEGDPQNDMFAGRRVLLADDNIINLEIDKQLLTERGMIVDIAENGQEALSQYMSNAPGTYDFILMDVRMPYMDGLTATKKIRASGKSDCKTIPILALTANAFEEDVRKTFECGMNAHITKPVNVKDMFKSIKKALLGKLDDE